MNFLRTFHVPKYSGRLKLLSEYIQKGHKWDICLSTSQIHEMSSQDLLSKQNDHQAEIDTALKIEANLFENSHQEHKRTTPKENKLRRIPSARNSTDTSKKISVNIREKNIKTFNDPDLGISITRLNVRSSILNKLMIPVRSKKDRKRKSQIIVEGRRLIQDALRCGMKMQTLLYSDKDKLMQLRDELINRKASNLFKIYEIAYHDLKLWSTLSTPPGIMGIFDKFSIKDKLQSSTPTIPITVVCDNIREPNNLGSIIRTCAAMPCYQVIMMHGCCDPWETKALRGGCGGQFRVPIHDNIHWEQLPMFIPREVADNCSVFIAENNLETTKKNSSTNIIDYSDINYAGLHNLVIIGGESYGISNDAYNFLKLSGEKGKCLNIPVAEGADSLNVVSALTLILFELRKLLISQS